MGGGLMQLVAYGAQDVYLTGNPQITFWKVTYRRHTNFAMESIEQTFNGQADFGRRVTCTISRNGDLAYRTYLQVTLPEINQSMGNSGVASVANNGVYARWLDFPGEQMISQVEVEIGGQRIDRQYGDWMHLWNQLTLSKEQERGYYKMVGNTTQLTYITDPSFANVDGPCDSDAPRQVCAPRNALPETTLYVPFQFWYCRNPGLALPLIALQYHEVKINLDIRPIDECLWAVSSMDCNTGASPTKVTTAYNQSLVAASLYVDYVFLDTDERRRMAQNPHEYLIEQLQFTGDESVGSSSNKIKLNFNHPCKELVWVVQPDSNVDYCSSLECGSLLYKTLGAQPFNYSDAVDALPNSIMAFGGPLGVAETTNAFISQSGLFADPGAVDVSTYEFWNTLPAATGGAYSVCWRRIALTGSHRQAAAQSGGGFANGHVTPVTVSPTLVSLTLARSSSPSALLTSTAGVRTRSSRLSFSLTDRTASQSARELTSISSSHTSTTLATRTLASTSTRSPFAPRSTSHLAHAISPALTTPRSSLSCPMPLLKAPTPLRSACMPPTTTSSVSCPAWAVSHTPTKQLVINYLSFIFYNINYEFYL